MKRKARRQSSEIELFELHNARFDWMERWFSELISSTESYFLVTSPLDFDSKCPICPTPISFARIENLFPTDAFISVACRPESTEFTLLFLERDPGEPCLTYGWHVLQTRDSEGFWINQFLPILGNTFVPVYSNYPNLFEQEKLSHTQFKADMDRVSGIKPPLPLIHIGRMTDPKGFKPCKNVALFWFTILDSKRNPGFLVTSFEEPLDKIARV